MTPPGAAHAADFTAVATAAEEALAAVGFEPRDHRAGGHGQALDDLSRVGAHPANLALAAFPGRMPQLSVGPGDAGDETTRLDHAQHGTGFGVDLIELSFAIPPHPQGALGPGQAGATVASRGRNGGQHTTRLRVDLLDAIGGELEQMATIERGAGVRADVERAPQLPTGGIEGMQSVSAREPDLLAVEGHAVDMLDRRERSVLIDDGGGQALHGLHARLDAETARAETGAW